MRLDKFLKNARIIIRRPVAKDIASQGRVKINSKVAKPGTQVSSNDVIEIHFGNRILTVRADQILNNPKKVDSSRMYTVLNNKMIKRHQSKRGEK